MSEMTQINQSGMKKNENLARIILFSIVIVHMFLRSAITVMPSALMSVIMSDMGLDYSQAGVIVYITSLVMGIFLFVGSSAIARLGAVRTLILAMVFLGLDGVFSFFIRNYWFVLLGRVLSGIGNGLSIGACSALIAAWFEKKHHGIANSISSIIYSVSFSAAYAITVPVYTSVNSWQNEMLLWAGLSIALGLVLLLWRFRKTDKTVTGSDKVQQRSSLKCAIKYKEVWYLAVAMTGLMWTYKCFMAYLPAYLSEFFGLSIAQASSVTGLMPLAGIIGSLGAGSIYHIIKKKKLLLWAPMLGAFAASFGIIVSLPGLMLYSCIFLFGFCYMAWCSVSSTLLMDLKGVTPSILSGLMAIMIGSGTFITIFAPFLFDLLKDITDMQTTFLIFSCMLVFSLASTLLYRDTQHDDMNQ